MSNIHRIAILSATSQIASLLTEAVSVLLAGMASMLDEIAAEKMSYS